MKVFWLDTDDSFSEAFDYVRENDKPERVRIGNKIWKLFPSGRADLVRELSPAEVEHEFYPRSDWKEMCSTCGKAFEAEIHT